MNCFPNVEIHSTHECQSTPTLCSHDESESTLTRSHNPQIEDSYARLSMSLEENFFKVSFAFFKMRIYLIIDSSIVFNA